MKFIFAVIDKGHRSNQSYIETKVGSTFNQNHRFWQEYKKCTYQGKLQGLVGNLISFDILDHNEEILHKIDKHGVYRVLSNTETVQVDP